MRKNMILYASGLSHDRYNAGSKAVSDAIDIASSLGYSIYYVYELPNMTKAPIKCLLTVISNIMATIRCFGFASIVIIQYPILSRTFTVLAKLFKFIFKTRVAILIHDLYTYRKDGVLDLSEIQAIKNADIIISHSVPMSNLLASSGITGKQIYNMFVFDYLIDKIKLQPRSLSKNICFAGNLDKSIFLRNIEECIGDKINLYLYGLYSENIKCSRQIEYKGKFSPNDISTIEGSWGLVWDGTSCNTCDGAYGRYMRINAPHKISLYIAAELPIIIWEESAIASFVRDHNLGICISSLYELEYRLAEVTDKEYQSYLLNIKKEAIKIRVGSRLHRILSSI